MEKIAKHGPHTLINEAEIEALYMKVKQYHEDYLSKYGVKMPAKGSAKALWLVYLAKYAGMLVHKDTISAFVSLNIPEAGKDQQVRHLARDGWYVLNKGEKLPDRDEKIKSGYHLLYSFESPKPSFLYEKLKRVGRVGAKDFVELKAVYDFRCATCGSQEGRPNFQDPSKHTQIQQGHMDPFKPLTLANSIPQCELCNRSYKNDFFFNEKGRITCVATEKPVLKAPKNVKEEILTKLVNERAQPTA